MRWPDADRPSEAGSPLLGMWTVAAMPAAQARMVDPTRGHAAGATEAASACLLGGHQCALGTGPWAPHPTVLQHRPKSLTCVRVDESENLEGTRKLIGGISLRGAPPIDLDLL